MARRVIFALLLVLAALACTTDPPARGGIFGDRPFDPPEESDAAPSDAGSDRVIDAPADRADTSVAKDVEVENDE